MDSVKQRRRSYLTQHLMACIPALVASELLEMIAQDDLYDAVLDRAKDA